MEPKAYNYPSAVGDHFAYSTKGCDQTCVPSLANNVYCCGGYIRESLEFTAQILNRLQSSAAFAKKDESIKKSDGLLGDSQHWAEEALRLRNNLERIIQILG